MSIAYNTIIPIGTIQYTHTNTMLRLNLQLIKKKIIFICKYYITKGSI